MFLFYALLGAVVLLWLYVNVAPVRGLRNLTYEEFKKECKGQKLIDVREAHEFKQGHIAGAVNIPLGALSSRISEFPKDKPIYLYCRSGRRSRMAAKLLSKRGYRQIAHLQGGLTAWKGPLKM